MFVLGNISYILITFLYALNYIKSKISGESHLLILSVVKRVNTNTIFIKNNEWPHIEIYNSNSCELITYKAHTCVYLLDWSQLFLSLHFFFLLKSHISLLTDQGPLELYLSNFKMTCESRVHHPCPLWFVSDCHFRIFPDFLIKHFLAKKHYAKGHKKQFTKENLFILYMTFTDCNKVQFC